MRLLVVEDENKVASFIKKGLEEEGYAVDLASDGETGLMMGLDGVHDLIILDVNLPKMDGLSVLQELRKKKVATPVLLLTVKATIEDKVLGLDSGADDYLTKPFAFQELLARVRALLRRRAEAEPPLLQIADLTLDPATRLVSRGDKKIELTTKEFALETTGKLRYSLESELVDVKSEMKELRTKARKASDEEKKAIQSQLARLEEKESSLEIKLRKLVQFLENGDKTKVTLRFRGREMAHKELGAKLLARVREDLDEYGSVEQMPQMEGRQMVMVIGPKKK